MSTLPKGSSITISGTGKVPWIWPGTTITRIIDGDSLIAHMTKDIGFNGFVSFDQKLRLNRINAPAIKTSNGQAAWTFLSTLLPSVGLVTLETLKPYKYGDEWMAEITLPNGQNVSDVMVATAHAVYWDGTGPRPSDG